MKLIYPALFHVEDGVYWVEFPDLTGCQTYGESLSETVMNAKEALEGYAISIMENKEKLPEPSDITSIKCENGAFATLIDVDVSAYLNKSKAIKKTLTIPQWLNDMAVEKGINFSQTLQDALILKLY